MDMTPPQAPPASIQSVHQQASEAFDRVVGLQAWLAAEQAALPALPDVEAGSLAPHLLALDAYWNEGPSDGAEGASRRETLTRRIANAARDMATIAQHDGVLDGTAVDLIRSITSSTIPHLPPGVTVRELVFGHAAYAGVLVLEDAHAADRVLSFSTERGWETFPSMAEVHAEMERRARRALVFMPDLRGVARAGLADIGPAPFVGSREIAADPFAVLVERLIDVQRDKLRQGWFEFALTTGDEAAAQALADAAFDALRLDHLFDAENVLATRHAALVEGANTERLERVPAKVAEDWRDAEAGYVSAQRSVEAEGTSAGLGTVSDLPTYAAAAIAERLKTLGVTQAPRDIQIRIDRGTDFAARLESLKALFEGPTPSFIPLVDLAYQNMAAFDPVRLSATTNDGLPILALNDATIRGLVRELDLSSRYGAYVESTFRSGSEATMRREHATRLQLAHMRLLAEEGRLSYYLPDAPRSFRADRSERGYRWVRAVLDAPVASRRARVEGHDLVVRQMTYRGTPLRDIVVVGVRHPESVPSIVLYTPDAPDGVTFREFDDRAEAARKFFYHPAFREYLLDRLPADYARVLPNGSARAFVGDHLANWVLGSPSTAAYTRTEAPFEEHEVSGDFLAAAYEVDVQLGLRNARSFTRSAEQAQWAWLVERVGNATTNKIVSDAIHGVVTAPARAAQAAWRLYDTVKTGDHAQIAVDFADFYNTSVAAALPAYSLGSTSMANAILGARFRAGAHLVEVRPPVRPAVVFEPRFAAKNIRKVGHANREGIFTIGGKTYIEHDGQMYRVLHDGDYGGWRLGRPDASTAFRGPAIQRTPSGDWAYRKVGLRGGSGRGAGASPERLPDLYDEYQAQVELAFPDPLERELVAARMRFERTAVDPALPVSIAPITVDQRLRWEWAVIRARGDHRVRQLGSGNAPSGSLAPGIPVHAEDLSSRYGGVRALPQAEAPEYLWYYGKLPLKNSDLNLLYDHVSGGHRASIPTQLFDGGVSGVRLTSVPPTASIERIREAMGVDNLARSRTFSVRVPSRLLYPGQDGTWNHLSSRLWGVDPGITVFVPNRGPGGVYLARPNYDSRLTLPARQFTVNTQLPPEAHP